MDPVRGLIHLGLKMTETTLDRALDVVRLADTLLVATAVPPMHERDTDASAWPDEEQADLDALSATLRARRSEPATTSEAQVSTTRTTPRKKTTPRNTSTKKAAPARKAPAKPASAKKRTATKATTSPAKKTAKKTTRKAATTPAKTAKKAVKKTATSAPAPTLSVLPDA